MGVVVFQFEVATGFQDAWVPVFSQAADLQLEMTQEPHQKPDPSKPLVFGKIFTDHMLVVEWKEEKGWGQPRIQPFQNLMLHPACSGLHYSMQAWPQPPSPSLCISSPLLCLLLSLFFPGRACFVCFFLLKICSLRSLVFQAPCSGMPGSPRRADPVLPLENPMFGL